MKTAAEVNNEYRCLNEKFKLIVCELQKDKKELQAQVHKEMFCVFFSF